MTDDGQLTLADVQLAAEQRVELMLRGGFQQPEIVACGYDPSLVARVAARLPEVLDVDRTPY